MLVAGLTGGIASGKTTVADIFRRAGARIIDADVAARRALEPGRAAWRAVIDQFGKRVIGTDGRINRTHLGAIVFQDARLRSRLEQIVHPAVRAQINARMAHLNRTSPHCVVIQDIPLLFEAGMTRGLAEVIVVYVDGPTQLRRLMQRDGIDAKEARARIDAQMPLEEKRRRATIVIDNSGDISQTEKQTKQVWGQISI